MINTLSDTAFASETVKRSSIRGSAIFSTCFQYRYLLERYTVMVGPPLCWLMLNPSKADANDDDPTIRKVLGFTERAGFGSAIVVNLFAFIETDPRLCREQLARAEGSWNILSVLDASTRVDTMVCAWGARTWARPQARRVLCALSEARRDGRPLRLTCLGTTKDGDPLHPLMPSYDGHPLVPFGGLRDVA